MSSYRAGATIVVRLPDKFKANGKPAGNAAWRDVPIPVGSRFSFYSGSAVPWLTALCNAQPILVLEA